MYFELSRKKLSLLAVLAAVLVVAVPASLVAYVRSQERLTALSYGVHRAESVLWYDLRFKAPEAVAAAIAAVSGVPQATTSAPIASRATSVPVLLYHGENGGPSMSTATFVAQLTALKNAGWHTVTLAQFEAFMQGKATLPDKSFLLTFDDGRRDTFYTADPVLQDLGDTAVMFVITGFSLPNNGDHSINDFYLDKAELAYMAASGRWELESHGDMDHYLYTVPAANALATDRSTVLDGHFLSDKFWLPSDKRSETAAEFTTRVTNDLETAKTTLEKDFGGTVTGYAYPLNDYGNESVNFPGALSIDTRVVPSIYRYAFYQTWDGNGDAFNYPDPSTWFVKRFEPQNSWTGAELVAYLDANAPKALPYAPTSFATGWDGDWGNVTQSAKTLALSAPDSATGASAYLDGSEAWTNYRIQATADISVGTFSLIARQTEADEPYFVCAFSDNRIYLEKHEGDTQTTLASRAYTPPEGARTIVMSVDGAGATCASGGISVYGASAAVPSYGGVGVSVWDPEAGSAHAGVNSFSVSAL